MRRVDKNKTFYVSNEYGRMRYFKNDDVILNNTHRNSLYEQDLIINKLYEYIVKSKVALDIGAHAGTHTVLYKRINKDLKIHAFEPQSEMFKLLQDNIALNGLGDVETYNAAVGNKAGFCTMSSTVRDGLNPFSPIPEYGSDTMCNYGGMEIGDGGEKVCMLKIDDLHFEACDYIKMDIEGYEPLALRGAENTIKTFKPVIMFEDNFKKSPEATETTVEVLESWGYKIVDMNYVCNFIALP